MAAMSIYGEKTLKNLLLQNQESFKAESCYIAWGLKVYQVYSDDEVCSNDDPRQTFNLFIVRSNLHLCAYVGENIENSVSQNVLKTNG